MSSRRFTTFPKEWRVYRHTENSSPSILCQFDSLQNLNMQLVSPHRLPPGEAFSVFHISTEFSVLTKAHWATVSKNEVDVLWRLTLDYLVFQNLVSIAQRGASFPIVGVFVRRQLTSFPWLFDVGIVTHVPKSAGLHYSWKWLVDCYSSCPQLASSNLHQQQELPFCRRQRCVQLKVWWTPSAKRIVPNSLLPDIVVSFLPNSFHSRTCPFTEVRILTARPFHSSIRGTSSKKISTESSQQQIFDDIQLTQPGEHLLLIEAAVAPEFRPFVPPAAIHIPPFMVVDL